MFTIRKFYLWAVLYRIIFELVYIYYISPSYSYVGLVYKPEITNFLISYFFFFTLLFLLPKNQQKPSTQLTQLLFINTTVPFLSLFWLADKSLQYALYVFICYVMLFVLISLFRPVDIQLLKKETNLIPLITNIVFIISIIILVLFTYKYGGIDERTLNFNTVYELRAEANYSGFWSYLGNWLSKLLLPVCIVVYMIEKKKYLFIISCMMQIYMYLVTGNKAVLFSVILITSTIYILKSKKWETGLAKLYSLIIIIAVATYEIIGNMWPMGIIMMRQLSLPASISFKYYDFFSQNDRLFFSEGLIGKLFGIESPYLNILAGNIISGSNVNYENTGFLSDAYANGGVIAMFFSIIILAFIFLYIDSVSLKSHSRYKYTALMVYPIIILNDGSLLTTLFSGGLFILLILMYILASEEKNLSNLKIKKQGVF